MSRVSDPTWLRLASRVYRSGLRLYPKALREAHGEEMLLAFEERCREAGRGRGAFSILALELLPDAVSSLGSEQWRDFSGGMRTRQVVALGLLCLSALGLMMQDRLGPPVVKWLVSVRDEVHDLREARALQRREAQVQRVADALQSQQTPASTALAAFLHRSLYSHRTLHYISADEGDPNDLHGLLPAHGARASALAAGVIAGNHDLYALTVAVQACEVATGCDRGAAIRRLVARDPGNGYGWALAFKWASLHGDETGMQAALRGLAAATHYQSYRGRMFADLIAASNRLAPDDTESQAAIARQVQDARHLDTEDFRHDVRLHCTPQPDAPWSGRSSRWIDRQPESAADCQAVAKVLLRSTDLMTARWASRRVNGSSASVAGSLWDPVLNIGITPLARRTFRPWTDAEWQEWAQTWAPGDGEVPAMHRWLASRSAADRAAAEAFHHP